VLVALALATLLSEDLACIAAGTLVARGELGFVQASAACFGGIFTGDALLYCAGRAFGSVALARAPLCWFLTKERVEAAAGWLERRGGWVVLATRFVPGTRLPTYFASGALGTSPARFLTWFALAGLFWTPLLVGLSAELGDSLAGAFAFLSEHGLALLLASALTLGLTLTFVRRLATRRGRALLRSSWRRLVRFEYWPSWALYAPIAVYIAWLALRHWSLRVVLAANPGMPLGGLVGESKGAILRALEPSGRVPPTLALDAALSTEERRTRVCAFAARHGLDLPLVVKPDVGERGSGVVVARSEDELARALARPLDLLVQAYVPGLEFGLFYARHPDWPRGRLVSLTSKHLPTVTGDGLRTLEELILADPRHLAMARFFLTAHAPSLARIPTTGELVLLGDLGTHCRGATFLDAAHLVTPALEAALDATSRTFAGFHLGRYDVRSPSAEALMRGEFTVLELNGLTSEPTHIHDPRHSLLHAWRTLAAQWRLAFEIGAANRRRPLAWSRIVAALWHRPAGSGTASVPPLPRTIA
jgi:membrane protein DedA with SNARE-associated domain